VELRHLKSLTVLAETEHFTRAAERLHIAQPALSDHIRKLEGELGIALVNRTTRRVSITDAGQLVVQRARRMLAEADATQDEIATLRGLTAGRLVIGLTPTPGPLDVAHVLSSFHATYPAVSLSVREALSTDLVHALHDDQLDVAYITGVPDDLTRGLDLHPVAQDRLVAIAPPGHRLASRRRIRLEELRDEPLISFPPGATIRTAVEARAATIALPLSIVYELSEGQRVRAFVAAGLGMAILPRADALAAGPTIAVLDLAGKPLNHEVFLASRRGRRSTPAARAFMSVATAQPRRSRE
jgi:LysR family transcriptional regulator, transcription activator of glutamate synthase operon